MNGKLRLAASVATVAVLASLSLAGILAAAGTTAPGSGRPLDALRRFAADFEAFGFEVATTEDPRPDAEGDWSSTRRPSSSPRRA